jgi:uncharacterized protein (TIGR02996 family)
VAVVVDIVEKGGAETRLSFDDTLEVTIGRVEGNHIMLSLGSVSKRHARLVLKDGKMIIVDLKSTNGTYVNGRKITSPLVIRETDNIYIGDYKLTFRIGDDELDEDDTAEIDITEQRLLAAIAMREAGSREIYADWLEEQGDLTRAEFLRLGEEAPTAMDEERFQQVAARLRYLGSLIDLEWRKKVARPAIENCGFELECPKQWSELAPTNAGNVRYCNSCQKRVFYCATVSEARTHAIAGDCVAVDVVALRRPRDLEYIRPVRMGMIVPHRDD